MSFSKYPKNYHANGYGWHNLAAMSYPKPQSPTRASSVSSGTSSIYPSSQLSYPTMPTLPGSQQPYQQFAGMPQMPPLPGSQNSNLGTQMSYGFAPNITPSHIPNVRREDTVDTGPSVGWNFGDSRSSSQSVDSGVHDQIQAQSEIPCQSIFVPDEDLPIYSFGQPYVSLDFFPII